MASLKQIIEEKLKRLESVPDAFAKKLTRVETAYLKAVYVLLSQLEQADGQILLNRRNLELLSEIEVALKEVFLTRTDYISIVNDYIKEFDKQAIINNSYFAKAFKEKQIPDIAKEVLRRKKENTLNLLLGEKLDVDFINPLREQIDMAVTSKASYSETLNAIQDIITGNAEIDSKLATYAKQITHDSFAISDRAYTKIVSDEIGAEWFNWAGTTISTSRTICLENHNKYFHKKEIEAMAVREWGGKMPGTNAQTIFETVGGFNCRHSLLPSSIFIVPKEVVQRAISKGFYEPSKFESGEIGL